MGPQLFTQSKGIVMRKVVLAAVLVLVASGAQAVTLTVVGGQLMGASGVDVGGTLYDVEFLDGGCIHVFNGCFNSYEHFEFQDSASAALASQALLDQVFVGVYDDDPTLTSGISALDRGWGYTFTPYGFEPPSAVSGQLTRNGTTVFGVLDSIVASSTGRTWENGPIINISGDDISVFAVWTDVAAVPEPSTALLLGLGLTGLAAKGRRRNRS
jgi:hypothetical protein